MIRSLSACLLSAAVLALSAQPAEADDSKARAAIASLVPQATIDSIGKAPVPGFYEVVLSGQVLYVSEDGKYLMQGMLFDVPTRTDLTETRRSTLRKTALADVSSDKKINFNPKQAKHTVTVFTDIDCGYCRRMHAQIGEYNALGIAVEYMFFPRSGPGTESWQKAVSVWCSDNPQQALTDAKEGKALDIKQCPNPVEEDYALANRIGVSGTPMVYAEDGTQLGGYVAPEQMLQRLDQIAAQSGK